MCWNIRKSYSSNNSGDLTGDVTGNCSGTSSNVTGTVAIANGGTGATTRLNAAKALTNENVGTDATYFITMTTSWGKFGYTSVANAKTVLGLGSAAYTASSDYATSSHTHGNITNSGTITSDTAIATGDKIVAIDADNNKVIRSGIAFDTTVTNKCLTQAGTWAEFNKYSLPLAASGTRGGIKIGYSESGTNYAVKLSDEKAYVTVPWENTKNTAGSTNTSSKIYLIGATSQGANPQTYSDDEVYTTSGTLTSAKTDTKAIIARTGTGEAGSTSSDDPPVQKPTKWTFNAGITVANGEVYFIKIPEAGGTYGVWASLNNGTNYYPVAVSNAKARFTTHYAKNTVIAVTYESAGKCTCYPLAGGTATSDVTGIFRVLNDYDANTNVTQTATTTNANYEVLFSSTADNTTRTEGARKNSNLKFNPSTGNLQTTQLNGVTIGSSPKFTDEKVKQTATSNTNTSYRVLYSASADDDTLTEGVRKGGLRFSPGVTNGGASLQIVDASAANSQLYSHSLYFLEGGTSGGFLWSGQKMQIMASTEASYTISLGVESSMWGLYPASTGVNLGTAGKKWGTVYAATGTINTSDRNDKKDIYDLTEQQSIDLIMDLKPVSYKYKDGKRTHYGMISQDVEETLDKLGMTAMDFAGFCKDQKYETYEVETADGQKVEKQRKIEGEYLYGLRYEEFIAPLIKTVQMQQTEINELKAQIKLLGGKG